MCSYPKYVCGWNDTSSLVTMCFIPCQPIVQLSQPQLTTYQPEPIRTLSELNPGFPWQKHWRWQEHGNKTRWDKNRKKYRTGQKHDMTLGQNKSDKMHNDGWITDKYKQMNPQGAGAKIKEISHKIILKFLIQGLHHPYTLPSKGEIVPPISIKTQKDVPTVNWWTFPHGNTHCPVPKIADSKICMCRSTH